MKFAHTLSTSAPPSAVWRLWTDVSTWPEWDTELKAARLDTPFALGAAGTLVPRTGPPSVFRITELTPKQSYTFTTTLPLCRLNIRRWFEQTADSTTFTHEVSFTGPLKAVFGLILGRQFRRQLPRVMEQLRDRAEADLSHADQPSASAQPYDERVTRRLRP